MDITLREYLSAADAAHDYVDKLGIILSVDKLEEKVAALQLSIKNIQAVAKRMADVSNIINQVILHRKAIIPNKIPSYAKLATVDPYPTENDHAVLRTVYPAKEESRSVVPGVTIPVRHVEHLHQIPISSIYYVNSTKQYAINISGIVLKGDLANIVEYQTEKSARCEYGTECKSFKNCTACKYYHDAEDYIKLSLPVPDDNTRCFTVGSYLYSKNKRPKTYFTRHIGSKDSLLYDLDTLKTIQYREEVANREGQLIHDLLIYLILHHKGLLERYPHWQHSSAE